MQGVFAAGRILVQDQRQTRSPGEGQIDPSVLRECRFQSEQRDTHGLCERPEPLDVLC